MSEWFETLTGMHDRAWQAMAGATGPGRQVALATVTDAGWPEARTVVLRSVDRADGALCVHTDRYSDKITSLRDNPRAALLFWDDALRLQVRAQAEVFIQTGQSVAKEWARVPDPQRLSYGTTPRPGTPILEGLGYDKPALQSAFAVLYCRVMALDLVHLGARHRRAGFTRGRDWAGQWLSP